MKLICYGLPDLGKVKGVALALLMVGFLLLTNDVQGQLFKAGVVAGINFTQIDGDEVAGYNKFGAHGGFMAQVDFAPQWYVSFEILYNQKGSRATARSGGDFKIVMDYADIPVLVKFHDKRGGLTFGAGLELGRLLRTKFVSQGIDATDSFIDSDKPKKWNLGAVADLTYMFKPAWGIGLRATNSFIKFRTDCVNSKFRKCGQFHRAVTLRTVFLFSALGKKGDVAD